MESVKILQRVTSTHAFAMGSIPTCTYRSPNTGALSHGESQVLERAGVPVVVDLPGVGNGYEDHHLMMYGYKSAFGDEDTAVALLAGRMGSMEDIVEENNPVLGGTLRQDSEEYTLRVEVTYRFRNAQEVQCKIRPNAKEIDNLGPEFKDALDTEFGDKPEKPLVVPSLIAG